MALVKHTQAHSWKEQIQQDRQYQQVMIGGSSVRWPLTLHIHRPQYQEAENHEECRRQSKHTFLLDSLKPYYPGSVSSLDSSSIAIKVTHPVIFVFHLQSFPDFFFSIHHQANSNTSSGIRSPLAGVAVLLLLRRHRVCVALSKNYTSRVSFSSA